MPLRSAIIFGLAVFIPLSAHAQRSAPYPGSGLEDPADPLPYAVDRYEGQAELVPVHHSLVQRNDRRQKNDSPAAATLEIQGARAQTVLHSRTPAFYVHPGNEVQANSRAAVNASFRIVQTICLQDRRIFARNASSRGIDKTTSTRGVLESTVEHLPSGWIKITPKAPLAPGEYALSPIPQAHRAPMDVVFDFSIDPSAPNAPYVIVAQDLNQSSQ